MNKRLSIAYSGHHAGHQFHEFENQTALKGEELQRRFSDYFSGETIPTHAHYFKSLYSRGVVDLNRPLEGDPTLQFNGHESMFPTKDFARPQRNDIWLPGKELTAEQRQWIKEYVYRPYLQQLLDTVRTFGRPGVVVAWDSSSQGSLWKEADGKTDHMFPAVIISNEGNRYQGGITAVEQEKGIITTSDPRFLAELAIELRRTLREQGLPDDVELNTYEGTPNDEGGNISRTFNTYRTPNLGTIHPVEGIQVEVNAQLHTDYNTLTYDPQKGAALKVAFERAMTRTYANLLNWNVGV
jgi:N-formylglutamate amidohydrolase